MNQSPETTFIFEKYKTISLYNSVLSLLGWDTEALLPKNSIEFRSDQMATLSALVQNQITDPRFVETVRNANEALTTETTFEQRSQLRRMLREVAIANAFDEHFVTRLSRAQNQSVNTWKEARKQKSFAHVQGALQSLVDLQKEWAQRLRENEALKPLYGNLSSYEIHLEQFEPGLESSTLRKWMKELQAALPAKVDAVIEKQRREWGGSASPASFQMPIEEQKQLTKKIAGALGFNFEKGRLDSSVHPFCGGSPDDVRMTTRYNEKDFTEALYGVIHESGHGMYEQGLPVHLRHTPCGVAASFGIHESQSRFFENQIGRSRPFCSYLAKETDTSAEDLFRHLNRVERSKIRTESDEVTYNLHILLRFEIEEDLINGSLNVADLPEIWRHRFEKLFGLKLEDDSEGCLQDIHWFGGTFGYFPSYAIGNLFAAELMKDFVTEKPEWVEAVKKGDCSAVRAFLKDRVHSQAAVRNSPETLKHALKGRELSPQTFLKSLNIKYL